MSKIAIQEQNNRMKQGYNQDKQDKIVLENLITNCSWTASKNGWYQ